MARALRAGGVAAEEALGGAELLALLDRDGVARAVIIDAALGPGPPGTVCVLAPADLASARPASSHGLGVAGALALLAVLRPGIDVAIVAVAIAAPASRVGVTGVAGLLPPDGLSPAALAAVPIAAAHARRLAGADRLL